MQPYDYTSAFAGVGSSYDAAMGGLKDGVAIRQMQAEQAQKQAALAQQKQMQAELAALSQNPTTQGIIAATLKYPQLSESFKRSFDMLQPEEQRGRLESATPVFMALHNNKPEIAAKLLREQATAYKNSGKAQEAEAAESKARMIEENPAAAKINLGGMLSAAIGPDKFAKMMGDMGDESRKAELQPSAVVEAGAKADKAGSDALTAKADAQTAGVKAKYAERDALADLEKKGWDIKKIQADIVSQKEQNRIGWYNAKIASETNGLKKQELQLKLSEFVRERDDKVREKVSKVEGAVTSMDNMLNTVERLLKNPDLDDVLGSIEGRMPSILSDGGSDAIALADQLGSQAFLSQVPNIQGMGALSNAEGEKLQAALQNFSRTQSESQFRANLREVQRLVTKGRETVSKRYGVPIGAPETPAAPQKTESAIPAGWTVQER